MAKSSVTYFSLSGALLLCATLLVLFNATDAVARVGVTSATDGDPLGKPPGETERVLRVGIDVQANEIITTKDDDRAHLVFLDGTSLTVGPNAQLVIDKFVFDPSTNTGDLGITASKGVFRLVGGKISKDKPITVTSPSGSMGIRGGIVIVNVGPTGTTWDFIFGHSMVVCALNQCQTVTQQGLQVTTAVGSSPSTPSVVGQVGLAALVSQLQGTPGKATGNAAVIDAITAANLNNAALLANLLALLPKPTAPDNAGVNFNNTGVAPSVNQSQLTEPN